MIYITNTSFKLKDTVVSLGNFDGVHLGHQELINTAKKYANKMNLSSVVFSFFPHPKNVLSNEKILSILTSDEKKYIFEKMGIDYYIEYPFDIDFSRLKPQEFLEEIIIKKLGCKVLIVGEGYKFGADKCGDAKLLLQLCSKYNITPVLMPHISLDNFKISSSNIRKLILDNDFKTVEKYLGKPYFIQGKILEGRKIGRTINFPTVNIISKEYKLLPSNGIYVTRCLLENKLYDSVTNIGMNPTVGGTFKTIETFIFDFEGNAYYKEITLYFYKKLRDEKKFNNIDELKNQIEQDVFDSKRFFGGLVL